MKKLLLLLSTFGSLTLGKAQVSEFYGNFSPVISHMVPIELKAAQPNHTVIKPNFKGRDEVIVDQSQTHLPDWVWQQHENTEKATSATIVWQGLGLGQNMSPQIQRLTPTVPLPWHPPILAEVRFFESSTKLQERQLRVPPPCNR